MKKLLGILVLVFLFSGNANAGVNEPGWGHIAGCKLTFAKIISHKFLLVNHIFNFS